MKSNALMVSFSLPTEAGATLTLLDISGRRIVSRDVGSLGAGQHTINLSEGRELFPGWYVIRLTQGVMVKTECVVVIR